MNNRSFGDLLKNYQSGDRGGSIGPDVEEVGVAEIAASDVAAAAPEGSVAAFIEPPLRLGARLDGPGLVLIPPFMYVPRAPPAEDENVAAE